MDILRESSISGNAWMLDRSGNSISVKYHPLGASDEDALDDANWLVENCKDNTIIDMCVEYAYSYYMSQYSDDAIYIFKEDAVEENWCSDFVNEVITKFDNRDSYDTNRCSTLSNHIKTYLNNNYLRCRYGGEYNSSSGNRELYFRISSTDAYNWYDIIMNFIFQFSRKIDTVTVETDINTTGKQKVYWNHLPIEDVLDTSKSTVLENKIIYSE